MSLRLRSATGRSLDVDFFFQVRTDPDVARSSIEPPPSVERHEEWYALKVATPRCTLYVIEIQDSLGHWFPAGTGRLDFTVHRSGLIAAWISLALLPAARGQGNGPKAIAHLGDIAARAGAVHLLAKIKGDNHASRRAFTKAGFVEDDVTMPEGLLCMSRTAQRVGV